jgi:hypothetical protein
MNVSFGSSAVLGDDDRLQIQRLNTTFVELVDSEGVTETADLFTQCSILILAGQEHHGAAAIAKWASARNPLPRRRHVLGDVALISVTARQVLGKNTIDVFEENDDGVPLQSIFRGTVHDVYWLDMRAGWRFLVREISPHEFDRPV